MRLYVRSFGATPTFVIEGHDAPGEGRAFGRDNRPLAAVGADGQALVWAVDAAPRRVHTFAVTNSLNSVTLARTQGAWLLDPEKVRFGRGICALARARSYRIRIQER